jgi:hypothetical protein
VPPVPTSIDPSYKGSIVSGKATDGVLPLSLDDAMQRGLRNNLGWCCRVAMKRSANGQRLAAVAAAAADGDRLGFDEVEQVNLAAYRAEVSGD